MTFFEESKGVREKIRKKITALTTTVPHTKLRNIIQQRNKTSSFLKGVLSYYIHEGVGGEFSEDKKIELATSIEFFCSSGAIFDNAIDSHTERNGKTTFLKEYGLWMQVAASQYVLHRGLKVLFPFLGEYIAHFSHLYGIDDAVIGMVGIDIERSKNLEEQIRTIERSNGRFAEVPLVIAASTGTKSKKRINNIAQYGYNLGTALGIYEEARDLVGDHGRRRATEVEDGRFVTPLHCVNKSLNIRSFVGRRLTDKEYDLLMTLLVQAGALRKTEKIALRYLNESRECLQKGVNTLCYNRLKNLSHSVEDSFDQLNRDIEQRYG